MASLLSNVTELPRRYRTATLTRYQNIRIESSRICGTIAACPLIRRSFSRGVPPFHDGGCWL